MSAPRQDVDPLPHLRAGENLGRGLRRVVRRCVELAGGEKALAPDAATVHQARRALKRARAVLRLAETLEVPRARTIRRRLATLARKLSPLRDETVISHLARKLESKADSDVRAALVELQLREVPLPGTAWWTAWRRRLATETRALDRLRWKSPTAPQLEKALAHSTKRVRRRARKARDSRDVATTHEWRKAVIAFREQVLVARPVFKRVPAALYERLHDLAHELGRATDLRVLLDAIREHDWPADLPEADEKLCAWLQKKQRHAIKPARRHWPTLKRDLRKAFA